MTIPGALPIASVSILVLVEIRGEAADCAAPVPGRVHSSEDKARDSGDKGNPSSSYRRVRCGSSPGDALHSRRPSNLDL